MRLKKNSHWYSVLASNYLLMHGVAQAEAVYVDIEPDLILDGGGEFTTIDLNYDGILDFGFMNTDFTWYDYPYGDVHFQRIMINPFPGNKVAGSSSSTLYSYFYFYPFALHEGAPINELLEFQNYWYQGMASRLYFFETFVVTQGNWYPEMLDHYLGINFIDASGHGHYGWIRCDVKDEGRTLVVKDYAYEKRVNAGIIAGDTIGDTTFEKAPSIDLDSLHQVEVASAHTLTDINIYSFDNSVYISITNLRANTLVSISNMAGQIVYIGEIKNKNTTISLNGMPEGNYIVTIQQGDKIISKQIYSN